MKKLRAPEHEELVDLGSFDTAEEAAMAYDRALMAVDPDANDFDLNFPENRASYEEEMEKIREVFSLDHKTMTLVRKPGYDEVGVSTAMISVIRKLFKGEH